MSTMDSEWLSVTNSEFGGVSCTIPPMVGGENSTVVGICEWSPASDERVGGCVQHGCISSKQGMPSLLHILTTIDYKNYTHKQTILCLYGHQHWYPNCICTSSPIYTITNTAHLDTNYQHTHTTITNVARFGIHAVTAIIFQSTALMAPQTQTVGSASTLLVVCWVRSREIVGCLKRMCTILPFHFSTIVFRVTHIMCCVSSQFTVLNSETTLIIIESCFRVLINSSKSGTRGLRDSERHQNEYWKHFASFHFRS